MVQRGIDEEEEDLEEEDLTPQAKLSATCSAETSPAISSNITSLKGGGQALPSSTRTFFESRFGCDFSRVRIHTGTPAGKTAHSLQAKAITVGRDVIFGTGQFSPETIEGRKLLAHELTHVVQQGATTDNTLRRATSEAYRVTELYEKRGDSPDDVFFDWNQPNPSYTTNPENDMDAAEAEKARNFARRMIAQGITTITLYGYASEEGNRSYNQRLAERRVEAVVNLIVGEGFDRNKITTKVELRKSEGQLDYRFWRSVEMKPDNQASSRKGSTAKHIQPCSLDQQKYVGNARNKAVALLNKAIHELDQFIANPSTDPQNRMVQALDHNFNNDHRVVTAREVRNRLDAMRTYLSKPTLLTTILKCADSEYAGCRSGGLAFANPTHLIVCPVFFDPKYAVYSDQALVHESAHGSRYKIHDRAYIRERVFVILNRDQALDNAESLMIFVLELHKRRPTTVGPTHPDIVSGCDPSVTTGPRPNEEKVRYAVAWAQRWNTYAFFGVSATYGDTTYENWMRPYFIHRFGRGDRAAMAGIYDRYRRMRKEFKPQLTITCVPNSDPRCRAGEFCYWTLPAIVGICPRFLPLGDLNRIIKIYAALARLMPGVPAYQGEAYPLLAKDYKEKFWRVIG